MRKALEDLPSGLDSTYARMLQSIDEDFRSQVIASLKWLACSVEPLNIGMLAEIFVLPSRYDGGFENISPLFTPMDVVKYFPGLIVIEKDVARTNPELLRIRLAHFSIKEYLTSDRILQSHASSFAFTESDAHMHIGCLCLAYHLHKSSMKGKLNLDLPENNHKQEVMEYASYHWAQHLEMIPHASWPPDILQNAVLSLSSRSQSLSNMVKRYPPWMDLIRRPHCYTASRGFHQLTEMLVSRCDGANIYLTQVDLDEGLQHATIRCRKSVAKLFLENGAQIGNCLETASSKGDAAFVGLFLDHGVKNNALGGKLESALQAALWNGHLDVLKLLLSRGGDVNGPFIKAKNVPMSDASSEQHVIDCLQFLFNNGAGVDMSADKSLTEALYVAIICRYEEVSRLLLGRGANVNELARPHQFSLQAAISRRPPNTEFIRYLLDLGADPNAQEGGSNTALNVACDMHLEEGQSIEIVKLLIEYGADVSIKEGAYGAAALQTACQNFKISTPLIQILLEKGADVNARGGYYGNALNALCMLETEQEHKLEAVKLLLSYGADVRAESGCYGTALQAACTCTQEHDTENVVRLLIRSGADVNTESGRYGTALQAACKTGNMAVVRLLLEEGALVNVEGGYHGTAFQAACAKGHIEVVRLLLEHGADIHLRNNGAWHAAAHARSEDVMRLLLDLGVDVNDPCGPHGTALHAALRLDWTFDKEYKTRSLNCQRKRDLDKFKLWMSRIKLLISRGADPNLVAGKYGTTLQTACAARPRSYYLKCTFTYPSSAGPGFLLGINPNIDINAQGGLFGSALQAAAYSGQTPTISLLLSKGAHVNARGGKYGSALNAAIIAYNWDIVQILLEAGAVPDCHILSEPNEEWLRSVLEDDDEGIGAVERYRKFWEVEMATQVDQEKEEEKV